jgi:palmitoyltransferase
VVGRVSWRPSPIADLTIVNYLLVKHDNKRAAIPILAVYFILFLLMAVTFLRLVYVTIFDPSYVPLGPSALRDRKEYKEKEEPRLPDEGIGMGQYDEHDGSEGTSSESSSPEDDPNSPGLELFYTKDVFVCGPDGRPIWCSQCSNW